MPTIRLVVALTVSICLPLTACGSDESASPDAKPTVVVTHSILGDVIEQAVGEHVEVVTIMGPGADPHDFGASAWDVDTIQSADLLIVNGGGFEEGLLDILENATSDGIATFEALSAVQVLEVEAEGVTTADPHFFTDPTRTAEAVGGVVDFLIAEIDTIDKGAIRASAASYVAELDALDRDLAAMFSVLDEADRVLVTNHEVFGYLADRYGFSVIGTVLSPAPRPTPRPARPTSRSSPPPSRPQVPRRSSSNGQPRTSWPRSLPTRWDRWSWSRCSPSRSETRTRAARTYLELMRTNAERITAAVAVRGSVASMPWT